MRPIIFAAAACLALAAPPGPAWGQTQAAALPVVATPSTAQGTLDSQQLDRLVAPIALYPDQVLTDILAAATYPAQVVEAARFVADPAHAGMSGAALSDAAAGEDWDPSVKALLMFPQVLQMMDSNLDWTEHLGRAFIAQQADVMAAVQNLRLAAEQAGTLQNGSGATVVNEGGDILINPPSDQDIYLPSYQPNCVFGPDPACDGLDNQVFWESGILLPYGYPQWGFLDWRRRNIRLREPAYGAASGGFRANGAGDLGSVWRHTTTRGASGGGITGNPGAFNYAPPANVAFARQGRFAPQAGLGARMFVTAHANSAPVFRAAPQHAPAPGASHAVSALHATGGGHR